MPNITEGSFLHATARTCKPSKYIIDNKTNAKTILTEDGQYCLITKFIWPASNLN